MAPPRSLARHPLFQVMLALNNTTAPSLELPGLRATVVEAERPTAKFDLTWDLTEEHDEAGRPAGLTGAVEYSSDLFEAATVRRFCGHFGRLVRAALAGPDRPIGALEILTEDEHRAAVDTHARTEAPDLPGQVPLQSVCDVLATQAAVTPARTALVGADEDVTFGDLVARVDSVALRLAAAGVRPGDRVAVALPRSAGQISAVFGVLRAGGVYVPLDPSHPTERNARILESARPAALLTERTCASALPASRTPARCPRRDPRCAGQLRPAVARRRTARDGPRLRAVHLGLDRPPQGRRRRAPGPGQPAPAPRWPDDRIGGTRRRRPPAPGGPDRGGDVRRLLGPAVVDGRRTRTASGGRRDPAGSRGTGGLPARAPGRRDRDHPPRRSSNSSGPAASSPPAAPGRGWWRWAANR